MCNTLMSFVKQARPRGLAPPGFLHPLIRASRPTNRKVQWTIQMPQAVKFRVDL